MPEDAKLYNVIYVWFSGLRGYGNQRGGFDLLTLLVGTPPSQSETKSVPQTWTENTSTEGDHQVKYRLYFDEYLSMIINEQIEILTNKTNSSSDRPQGASEGRQRRDSSESTASEFRDGLSRQQSCSPGSTDQYTRSGERRKVMSTTMLIALTHLIMIHWLNTLGEFDSY